MKDSLENIKSEIDSIETALFLLDSNISETNDSLLLHFSNIETKIDSLQPDLAHEFIYPILLSIISGFIFWLFFSYLPELSRKYKIRVKIEFEIYQVYSSIFTLFDTVLRHQERSPSFYQSEIRSGNLTSELTEMALQNKCLNEHYFYDDKTSGKLIPIGKRLWEITRKTDQLIDRIFNFSFYLTSNEILLLDEIRKKLHTYDVENYDKNPAAVLGGKVLLPVNPSLAYMKHNLNEVYHLYKKLQNMVFDQKRETRDIFIHKVQFLFYSKNYNEVIRQVRSKKKKYPKDEQFLDSYLSLSLYHTGEFDKAFEILKKQFASGINLIPQRHFIMLFGEDERINKLLQEFYSESKFLEYQNVIDRERSQNELFVSNSEKLKEYYNSKRARK